MNTAVKKKSHWLRNIFLLLLLAIAILAVLASRKPDEFHVERSLIMSATAPEVFEHVNNLQKWEAWSPWAKLDPNAKTTFEGPQSGKGAIMHWDGNMEVGAGTMTITESDVPDTIQFQLDFLKPFKSTSTAEFMFVEEDGETTVTWSMDGKSNFLSKMMSVIFDCEKMVGEQFEKGLSSLKSIVEK